MLITIIHSKLSVDRKPNCLLSVQSHSTIGDKRLLHTPPKKKSSAHFCHSLAFCVLLLLQGIKNPCSTPFFLNYITWHNERHQFSVQALPYLCLNQHNYNATVKSLKCNIGQLGFSKAGFWMLRTEQRIGLQ